MQKMSSLMYGERTKQTQFQSQIGKGGSRSPNKGLKQVLWLDTQRNTVKHEERNKTNCRTWELSPIVVGGWKELREQG